MSSSPSPPARFDVLTQRVFHVAGQVALVCALWFGLIRFPSPPTPGLDSSWQMVLGYATAHGLQFGSDIVFTYGPLGYLMAATNLGEHFGQHLAWQLGINLIFAVAIYLLGREFRGWRQVVFYIFFLGYGTAYLDSAHMIVILIMGLALTRENIVNRAWLSGLIAAVLAVLGLVKFTNLLLAGFAVVCVIGWLAWRRRWLHLLVVSGSFLLTFVGLWAALGQHLGNLLPYVRNSLEISSGYNAAMGVDESGTMFVTGLTAALTLLSYLGLTLYRASDFPRALTVFLIAGAASFINWKHGFVRADGHVTAHFYLCLLYVCTFPVLLQDNGPLRRLKGGLLVACAVFCLSGVWQNSLPWITNVPAFYNLRVMENLNTLAVVQDLSRNARDQFHAVEKDQQLPATKLLVGEQSVDIIGNEQAYAFFNHLNYRPRPIFQSYSAYTERLARLNEAFMASPKAPQFVMLKMQTIDNRLPSLDDSLVLRYLFHHYSYVTEERGFLVWKRKAADAALDKRDLLSARKIGFGELIPVPVAGDDEPVWCEIDLRPSLLGRLRSFLYKPVSPNLLVADGDNFRTVYRIIPGMMRAGFLLHPYLTSNYAIAKYAEGSTAPRLQQFAVQLEPGLQKYFQQDIRLRLYRLPPFPRTPGGGLKTPEVRFRVFSDAPVSVNALFPPEVIPENNKEVLLTHPPSELEFKVPANVRKITGKFGFVANAYTNGHTTDGAEFIVEWMDTTGKRTRLFYRHLRPLTYPQDRGEQSFDFAPPGGEGRMFLRITPGPESNIAFDWTYWTDLKLVR